MRQLLVLIACIAVWAWSQRSGPGYEPLYRALTLQPLVHERLAQELRLQKIPCEVRPDGLWVPVGQAARARWMLAVQGLPSSIQVLNEEPPAGLRHRELQETLPRSARFASYQHRDFEPVTLFYPERQTAPAALHLCQLYLGGPVRVLKPDATDLLGTSGEPALADLERRAQKQLDAALGPGRAAIQVAGQLDPLQVSGGPVEFAETGFNYVGASRVCGCGHYVRPPQACLVRLSVELWLTPEAQKHADRLSWLVRSAIGLDEARGDLLYVERLGVPEL